jgi:hypothetical protein
MNRRTLLASFAVALTLPCLAQAAPSASRCGTAFRTFEHPPAAGAGHASLSVKVRRQGGIVAPLPTADELLAPVIEAGHERAGIEFYIVAQDTLPAPPELDLESIFVTWISLEGAAAVKRTGGIAVLQDGGTRWTITAGGDDTGRDDLLMEVAGVVSRLGSGGEEALPALLPAEADLPPGWQLATEWITLEPCER